MFGMGHLQVQAVFDMGHLKVQAMFDNTHLKVLTMFGVRHMKVQAMFVLFDFILYVPSAIFQLNWDGSFWVQPVLNSIFYVFTLIFGDNFFYY